jgi:FAD/FMN-containing dehydrogenase
LSDSNPSSRRQFVAGVGAAAAGAFLGASAHGEAPEVSIPTASLDLLKKNCRGTVVGSGEPEFAERVYEGLWNRLLPARAPQIVVCAADEQDVISAIQFARENKLKVVVRGGGHNWCQPTLRNGGLLIDLKNLNKVISLDVATRKAVVQPVISNREIQRVLNAKGLAYPSGHCPQVKLSGYLLGGGMSWNQGVWGYGNESVEAVELVTAEGKLITANQHDHADYFWAARGAGYGFFGVATCYHLKLYSLPKAIHGITYYYSLSDAPTVAEWLGNVAPKLSPAVELSVFLLTAPPELKEKAAADGGKLCMISPTVFADSAEEAKAALQPFQGCPAIGNCLLQTPIRPLVFEEMFDASGALWPEGMRNHVKAIFSNSSPGELVRVLSPHIIKAPSPITLVLFAIFTGPNVPAALPQAALSLSARLYGGPWTMWRDAADDESNTAWHRECVRLMKPYITGYYIGETDPVAVPSEATGAFSPESWKRLADLRDKYDPEGVFFGYFDGLS